MSESIWDGTTVEEALSISKSPGACDVKVVDNALKVLAREVQALRQQLKRVAAELPEGHVALASAKQIQVDGGGLRKDNGKLRYDLVPPDALEQAVAVFTKGALKYEPRNWERGMSWSKAFSPLQRHCWKWWQGERNDRETGLHHMAHAAVNTMFLLAWELRSMGEFDDRPKFRFDPHAWGKNKQTEE